MADRQTVGGLIGYPGAAKTADPEYEAIQRRQKMSQEKPSAAEDPKANLDYTKEKYPFGSPLDNLKKAFGK